MIVEVQRSRQFDDSIADKHWTLPPNLTIMEENLNSLADMEGYLEVKIVVDNSHPIFSHNHHRHYYDNHHPHLQKSKVKSAKMLTPNKKYWFVLSQSCLDFYENK